MKPFHVWVSSKADGCLVRVDGLKNALWLLDLLSGLFVFKTSESLHEEFETASVSFSVIHSFQMTQPRFERLLASIPEVRLTRITVPARI